MDTWKGPTGHAATLRWRAAAGTAAALHRRAAATAAAAATALDAIRPIPADQREQHELAERLRAAASLLTPGWLGAPLDAQSEDAPLGGPAQPAFVRIGTAQPLDDARFPVVVPLLGTGHLTVDADSRDPRVAGLLRSVLLRLLAAAPAGSLLVRGVDATAEGQLFAPFAPLADAGLMPPPVTDRTGLRAVLAEAEQWVRPTRPAAARYNRHDRTLLVVVGSLPELTEAADLARIGALAREGPEAGLHLIVAGWPPPPLTAETSQAPLARSTMIAMRNPYALVGDPPGGPFSAPVPHLPGTGLNSPVFLDECPPVPLLDRVCRDLAARFHADYRRTVDDLLPESPDGFWTESSADGLSTPVGHDGERTVPLGFDERTPHWLVGGRDAAGKSAFLVNVLYGLCTRYHPDELALYLVDFADGTAFTEFVPEPADGSDGTAPGGPWLPHVRAVGVQADREYGLAVLRELDAELDRRTAPETRVPAQRGASARPAHRILCVLDEFALLLADEDEIGTEALARLESVARRGRSAGVHLILTGRPTPVLAALRARRDSFLGQFPVRVALPGGADVLEPTNDSAAGLPLGTAVVNTAGGLGGPRGATRGHERTVRFPDPHADPGALSGLRHRLWADRPAGTPAPGVFTGYLTPPAPPVPAPGAGPDTTVRREPAVAAPTAGPAAAGGARTDATDGPAAVIGAPVGLLVDVPPRPAELPLDRSPGRHLAVLGADPAGAGVLAGAARGLAARHPAGSVEFMVAAPAADPAADALTAELARRHRVGRVDAAGLAGALELAGPGYLVLFAADELVAGAHLSADRIRALLRDGPARGVHLLGWWRATAPFAALLATPPQPEAAPPQPEKAPGAEEAPGPEDVAGAEHVRGPEDVRGPEAVVGDEVAGPDGGAGSEAGGSSEPGDGAGAVAAGGATVDGLVLLDVPETEVAGLLGRPVRWRPRPGRALLYDRRTGQASLVVPYAAPGGEGRP
ncbi:FtsK/SpoIIIE domain-containing protein [Plantactinospora endophytica]|uniref:FtsK/SpoIIIE domain-containing protein n=1 Tax=Plantactinospora endophytica TaxID=673535 RepID=UPI001EF18693|nr:FtsK/SpoIIIE domain-containing protein [Plantactinospora endophytica]